MRIYTGVSLIVLLIINQGFSQSIEQIKADRQNYIWGEGSGMTLQSADQDALAMIISQISVQVESSYSLLQEEVVQGGRSTFRDVLQGVVNTYSSAALHNTERIVISNEPDAKVFRYIRRADVQKIFEQREKKIQDFLRSGLAAEQNIQPSFALRYYYWALTLLRSHPENGSLAWTDGQGNTELLNVKLHRLINGVFSNMSFTVSDIQQEDNLATFLLDIRFRGKPAKIFDYSYFTGRDWTNLYSARDGLGIAQFSGSNTPEILQIRAEYAFTEEAHIDRELYDVMQQLQVVPFRTSYYSVPVRPVSALQSQSAAVAPVQPTASISMVEETGIYRQRIETLMQAIRTQNHASANHLFTPEGLEMYRELLQYGRARIVGEPELLFHTFEDGVVARAIPMSFSFRNNTRTFLEDLVIRFDKDARISSLAFGLGQEAVRDIADNEKWGDHVKMVLINFLENYKTAYALKRLDYIESIFHDEALIITGTVLQANTSIEVRHANHPVVRYNHFTKEEFIRHLRRSFNSNEFINIRFEDNTVAKAGVGGEIYGINIRQDYFSSNYGDSGYLFLMVDVNEPDRPIIHVRTWQPGNVDAEELIRLTSF